MDVVKNVYEHYQKIEKLVYVKFLKMFGKLNFHQKAVNYVDVMAVIQEILER
jgi:hypothetical protein